MAKYKLPGYIPPFTGTRYGFCIYKMWGRYYLRSASSLTAERVKKDPAFQATMKNANRLGRASRLASQVYKLIPAEQKAIKLYRQITGRAMDWLKEGKEEGEIIWLLQQEFIPAAVQEVSPRKSYAIIKLRGRSYIYFGSCRNSRFTFFQASFIAATISKLPADEYSSIHFINSS